MKKTYKMKSICINTNCHSGTPWATITIEESTKSCCGPCEYCCNNEGKRKTTFKYTFTCTGCEVERSFTWVATFDKFDNPMMEARKMAMRKLMMVYACPPNPNGIPHYGKALHKQQLQSAAIMLQAELHRDQWKLLEEEE